MTGVYPARTHGFGVYCGKRKVWSVRVDENLLKAAKPLLRAKFGSECRGVETWLAGLVATTKGEELRGAYPSNTVEIGKVVIERNLRSRRKLEFEKEVVERSVEVTCCGFCGKPLVVARFRHVSGVEKDSCDFDFEQLKNHPKWSLVQVYNGEFEHASNGTV